MSINAYQLIEAVRENAARLKGCSAHQFPDRTVFGQPWVCELCGGQMKASSVFVYCAGFQAAGGDASRVWGPWKA